MKRQRMVSVLILGLLLVMAVGLGQAQGPESANSIQGIPVDTGFTYQGKLEKNDIPVDALCSFRFELYDLIIGGSQVGSADIQAGIEVTDGLFTTKLNEANEFGDNAFIGEARYLAIKVQCPGDADYVLLWPRQELTAMPYALGLGLPLTGVASTGAGTDLFYLRNSGEGRAFQAVADSDTAVWANTTSGFAGVDGRSGSGHGVYAYSDGSGLYGSALYANSGHEDGIAIWGSSNSTDSTLVVTNDGSGDLIRGFSSGWNMRFRVENDGRTTVGVLAITGGSDLSEQFDVQAAEKEARPGTLLSIDPEHPGQLIPSRQAYDRRVAGIISGAGGIQTGMLMGQEGSKADGAHPVALSGRVYCWADASYGAIEPGDLLTTSDTPGHAMKVTDYERAQGAIVGKAMSSLDQGRGLILILVSLQ